MTTSEIIEEVTRTTRDGAARAYADAIMNGNGTDWKALNEAIIARWSTSALEYIKHEAWKLVRRGGK